MSIYSDQGTAAHAVLDSCLSAELLLNGTLSVYPRNDPSLLTPDRIIGTQIQIPADKETDHHALGPSSSKRWRTCTAAHMATKGIKKTLEGARSVEFTKSDARAVQLAIDYVRDRVHTLRSVHALSNDDIKVYLERKVHLGKWIRELEPTLKPHGFYAGICDGTSDVTLVVPKIGFIEQIDYKHGAGVPVSTADPQNSLYLLGALAEFEDPQEFKTARLTIIQPRCPSVDAIRSMDIPDVPAWLHEEIPTLLEAVTLNFAPETQVFAPGVETCRWCPIGKQAKYTGAKPCEHYIREAETALQYSVDSGVPAIDPEIMNIKNLTQVLIRKELIIGAIEAMENRAIRLMTDETEKQTKDAQYLARFFSVGETSAAPAYNPDLSEAERIDALKKIKIVDPDTDKRRPLKKTEMFTASLKPPVQIKKTFENFKSLTPVDRMALNRVIVSQTEAPKLTVRPCPLPGNEVDQIPLPMTETS